jgi:hypothetical protein
VNYSRRGARLRAAAIAVLTSGALALAVATSVAAHQEVQFQDYAIEVGFINEPVYVGDKSGLEFSVSKNASPVQGLEQTLKAQVTYQGQTRDLDINGISEDTDFYRAFFIPTAAGPYTFHISGTIEGNAFDQSFTSGPDTFDEVKEAQSGEFPVQLPTLAELQATAQKGADAANQVTIALVLGGAGVLLGLVGIGLALAVRRRPAA